MASKARKPHTAPLAVNRCTPQASKYRIQRLLSFEDFIHALTRRFLQPCVISGSMRPAMKLRKAVKCEDYTIPTLENCAFRPLQKRNFQGSSVSHYKLKAWLSCD
jgi:hypothetical protein